MAVLHETSPFNIQATLTDWYTRTLATIDRPAYLPSYTVVVDWQDIPLALPCFSISHIPVGSFRRWQGDVESTITSVVRSVGLLEINCWVSRDQKHAGQDVWSARLNFMESMVRHVHQTAPVLVLSDFMALPGNPIETEYLVRQEDLNIIQTAQDANPAIMRRRVQVKYTWNQRARV